MLQLYAHPFSSYCQKVLIALYEHGTPFALRQLNFDDEAVIGEWAALWPIRRMPLLVDDGRTIMESSIIIEHLDLHHPGAARLLPGAPEAALEVRMLDRIFDHYVMTPLQKLVFDRMRPEGARDPHGVTDAQALLDTSYAWIDRHMAGREWAAAGAFSLADCAAAPALFYADWVRPISPEHAHLRAYRARLLGRPSYARIVEEARPHRGLFPGGAPDRD